MAIIAVLNDETTTIVCLVPKDKLNDFDLNDWREKRKESLHLLGIKRVFPFYF